MSGAVRRVLVATNMYPSASDPAFGSFVSSHVEALRAAGLSVDVYFINGRRSTWEYIRGIVRLRHIGRGRRYDVVHAHYGLTGFASLFQALPLVVTFHGDDLLGTPARSGGITHKSKLTRRLSLCAARRADGLICVSEELRQALPFEHRLRTRVIPGGIDVERFGPGDRAAARRRLGWSEDAKIVLFPSTPSELRKRLDLAEASVRRLKASIPRLEMVVVQGVPQASMPDYYRAANCLLLTSDWEGSPTVIKEALCCDLPVVSVDAGDAWTWLKLVEGCERVERRVESLSDAIGRVLNRGGHIDGGPIRKRVDWRTMIKEVIDVYETVKNGRSQSAL